MQLPKYGIENINNSSQQVSLSEGAFPWVDGPVELSAARVNLEGGETVLYASAVGLNSSVEKLARKVPDEQSQNAEQGLFKGLSTYLAGGSPANFDTVAGVDIDGEVFKVSKSGRNAARLYFAVIRTGEEPLVVKLGIANHDQQIALQGIIGNVRRRQKKDGRSR